MSASTSASSTSIETTGSSTEASSEPSTTSSTTQNGLATGEGNNSRSPVVKRPRTQPSKGPAKKKSSTAAKRLVSAQGRTGSKTSLSYSYPRYFLGGFLWSWQVKFFFKTLDVCLFFKFVVFFGRVCFVLLIWVFFICHLCLSSTKTFPLFFCSSCWPCFIFSVIPS